MIELKGKYNTAKVFTDNIEQEAVSQIIELCNQEFVKDSKIRIMPDTHAGAGCVIGFTADLGDKVIPNIVGVDIGCLDKDTEVLTPNGWIKISEYKNEKILVFNKKANIGYFEEPYAYIKENCKEFYHFKNHKGLDQIVSNEHKMLVYKGYKNRGYITEDLRPSKLLEKTLDKSYYSFESTFNLQNQEGIKMTDNQIRLDVMIQADGTIRNNNTYELHFSKERKIKRAKLLLEIEKIKYNEYINSDRTTTIVFKTDLNFTKNLNKYYLATKEQLNVLIDEVLHWDGHYGYRSFYSTTDKNTADVVQFAYASNGIRAGINVVQSKKENWKNVYVVVPTKNSKVGYSNDCKIIPSVDGKKYCFTTFTGYFVARRNGKIFVTGNCGMLTVELGNVNINLKQLDEIIHNHIPSGLNVHEGRVVKFDKLQELFCYRELKDTKRIERSMGTLGGGNHFIELDKDDEGNIYLIIHSGSRNLGKQVADYYQNIAIDVCSGKEDFYIQRDRIIKEYKEQGKKQLIQNALKELKNKYEMLQPKYPKQLCYLTGEFREKYLNDMNICQEYAVLNRKTMADIILKKLFNKGLDDFEYFNTTHNYINFNDNIIRKGSISAYEGEKVLIPINMRDGSLICIGKGNPDWNYSAPHGAGRLMSRSKAKEFVTMDEYRESMEGIYTTSVNQSTIDESPMAYKPMQEIIDNIQDTVEILKVIKPIYNFKAGE